MPNPYAVAAMATLNVMSGFQQAEMIGRQADLTERLGEMNAKYAEIDAYEAEKFGESEVARYQKVIDSTIADQRLAYASQGVDVNYGTAAEVQEETQLTGFLNKLEIMKAAHSKAKGLRNEAANYRVGGFMNRVQSDMNAYGARASGIMNAANVGLSAYARK